jgi:tetratricopeptide (TPR) repeat protein
MGNQGFAHRGLRQVERAIEHHTQALAIARKIGDRRGEGSRLGNLGLTYSDLGQVERAIEHAEDAFGILGDQELHRRHGALEVG